MSHNKPMTGENLLIGREHWDVPLRVELLAYVRFNRRIDSQLRRLVVRWAHTAPPCVRARSETRGRTTTLLPPTTPGRSQK